MYRGDYMSILGIDIGTTGTKAIVFSDEGKILTSAYLEYAQIFPKAGWVEFDVNHTIIKKNQGTGRYLL